MDDLADGDVASQCLREHEGIKGQQQLVVLGELVAEDEADRDELCGAAATLGRDPFDGVDNRFDGVRIHRRLRYDTRRQPPLG